MQIVRLRFYRSSQVKYNCSGVGAKKEGFLSFCFLF